MLISSITVVDAMMGSGKTTWALNYINSHPEEKVLYVTPLLSEFNRIRAGCSRLFIEPHSWPTKAEDFSRLITSGNDSIITTHQTFLKIGKEESQKISDGGFTVMIDEAFDPFIDFEDLYRSSYGDEDRDLLNDRKLITIGDDGLVTWISQKDYSKSVYGALAKYARSGGLYYFDNTFFVWKFPPDLFFGNAKIYIMTYLFQGQTLDAYFREYGIPFEHMSLSINDDHRELCPYDRLLEKREQIASLINIYEDKKEACKMNGYLGFDLSHNWFKNAKRRKTDTLKKHMYNFVRNITKASSERVMWTSYKDCEDSLKGAGYTRTRNLTEKERALDKEAKETLKEKLECFVSSTCRATNDYADRDVLMYIMNYYPPEYLMRHYEKRTTPEGEAISINRDLWTFSNFLQWAFRSAIRNGRPVDLYLPSARMRDIYQKWVRFEL